MEYIIIKEHNNAVGEVHERNHWGDENENNNDKITVMKGLFFSSLFEACCSGYCNFTFILILTPILL